MDQLSSFLHSETWQRFQKVAGAHVEKEGKNLFIHRSLPLGGSYWQSSRCEVGPEWKLPQFAQKSWFVRLEPESALSFEHLKKNGRLRETVSIQPRQTMYLDLTQDADTLLANMKSKHRYNIRLAAKHEVKTELYSQNLLEHFPRFWKLLNETATRHTFRTHSQSYYQKMLEELEKDGMIHLAFATHEGQDLATLLIITHDEVATYLHGASTQAKKELMAPHLLHWNTIQEIQKKGMKKYDFWGTHARKTEEGWEALTDHPSTGTTRFKLGFAGQIVEYPGCFDLILNPFCYTLYSAIRGFRSRKRAFS